MGGGRKKWWSGEALAARRENLRRRGALMAVLRDFFASRDFVEVETPALQVSPGLEPHLKAFATKLEDPFGGDDRPMYLHTSPE
ncbi:MAG: EF-P lysine aminoacylase GenX, partial [Rhodospirillaceae bacterium]|nr:EF-P lysine aminoacylase GenX [Rhodospirillaceae bacterium]